MAVGQHRDTLVGLPERSSYTLDQGSRFLHIPMLAALDLSADLRFWTILDTGLLFLSSLSQESKRGGSGRAGQSGGIRGAA